MPAPQPGQVINGFSFVGGDPSQQQNWKMLTGDDYAKTLAPQDLNATKMLTDGRMPFPGSMALKTPYWQQKLAQAQQYDPSFDATSWPSRVATRRSFTAGPDAQTVASLNTVMGHLQTLKQAADALHNHELTPLNAVGNFIEPMMGDPRVNNFNVAKNAAASELTRAFRGSGGAEADVKDWQNTLDPNGSPEQLQGGISQAVGLLKSRIDAMGDKYSKGMGRAQDGLELLSPHAKAAYQALSGDGQQPNAAPQPSGLPPSPQNLPRLPSAQGPQPQDIVNELRRRGVVK